MAASTGADEIAAAAARRRAFLASRLAKAHLKETTLDLALPASIGPALAEPRALETFDRTPVLARDPFAKHPVAAPEAPAPVATARRHERRREHGLEL